MIKYFFQNGAFFTADLLKRLRSYLEFGTLVKLLKIISFYSWGKFPLENEILKENDILQECF